MLDLHTADIKLADIELDPDNPRKLSVDLEILKRRMGEQQNITRDIQDDVSSLKSLSESIKDQGLIHPILAYQIDSKKYRLISGERRVCASILAGMEKISARIFKDKPSSLELSIIQWAENMEREDLSLWERLNNVRMIVDCYAKERSISGNEVKKRELAGLLGCSFQQATNYAALLDPPKVLLRAIRGGQIKNIEKAAVIARASPLILERLVSDCIAGATLTQLKLVSRARSKKSKKSKKGGLSEICPEREIAELIVNALICAVKDQDVKVKAQKAVTDFSDIDVIFFELVQHLSQNHKPERS